MVFTKGTEYAFKALVFMARRPEQEFFGVKELSAELSVSGSYLAKILQRLVRENYLRSVTGPGGGFGLNDKARKSTMLKILESVEDKGFLQRCILGASPCREKNPCPFHAIWKESREEMAEKLSQLTIFDVSDISWPVMKPGSAGKKKKQS
jgi:Rrf2 family protein